MTLTSPPTAIAPFEKGRLAAGISASATTITVSPIYKTVNGVRTKQGFNSTSGIAIISQGDYTERISFEGASVDSTTKVTSLTTCVRGLSATSTSASFSGGTGRIWPKGAKITLVADVSYFQSGVFTNVANSFSALQTFTQGINVSGKYMQLPVFADATARDVAIASPSNGMMVYNTGTGTIQQYIAGAWVNNGTDTTSNGSTTVAGKFEEATQAEQAALTATGDTGARLVPAVANLVVAGAGAGDSGKIPILGTDGALAVSVGGTGLTTLTANNVILGNGTSDPTFVAPSTTGNVLTSNGTTWASSAPSFARIYSNSADLATVGSDTSEQTLIPATAIASTFWSVGKTIIVDGFIAIKSSAAPTFTWKLKLGSTALLTYADAPAAADTQIEFKAIIVCRATGAGGSFMTTLVTNDTTTIVYSPTDQANNASTTVSVDVSSSVDFSMTVQCGASHANNLVRVRNIAVYAF